MKNIVFISFLFMTKAFFGQVIDTNNFNYPELEKMILKKINEYRKTKNLNTLACSEVLKINVSVRTSSANALKDSLFHMLFPQNDTVLSRKLYNELYKITNGKCGNKIPLFIGVPDGGEIICAHKGLHETYDELASTIVNSWLNSPKHKAIIENKFEVIGNTPGLFSCSVKKSKGGRYYSTVNFVCIFGLF